MHALGGVGGVGPATTAVTAAAREVAVDILVTLHPVAGDMPWHDIPGRGRVVTPPPPP